MHHPSQILNSTFTDLLRGYAAEAEHLKQLHPCQLELIHEQAWLKMFVPKNYGGLALPLPTILRIEESLAWTDGSVGWIITLCAGAAWFVGFLDSSLSADLFADQKVCFAGSGMATGIADVTDNGYRLNGRWKYASGAMHSTVFTANFHIHKNERQLVDENGFPSVCAFVMKRDEVVLNKTWHSMGMIATGSHAFEVNDLNTETHRCFCIDPIHAIINDPVYRYPFAQLAETTLAVNLSGMAMRFIDLCEDIFSYRRKGDASVQKKKLEEYRKRFYDEVESSWQECVDRDIVSEGKRLKVTGASHTMVRCCREVVNELYPHCGLAAADVRGELNRVWRNLHTATQHSLFSAKI